MHVLTLFVEGIATPFSLHYRGAGEAKVAMERVICSEWSSEMTFTDDYGQVVAATRSAIKAIVMIDVARGIEAHMALMKLQEKAMPKPPTLRPGPSWVPQQ